MFRETNAQPVHQGEGPVLRRQRRENVRHRRQHRQPGAPTFLPVQQAEVGALAHRARAPSSGPSSSIRPSTALARTRVRPCSRPSASRRRWWPARVVLGPQDHEDVGTVDLDAVCPDVVGEGVEGAPRGEVETGVVPVAGQKAVLDGPPVERETHMRAAVVHGERLAVGPEHADGLGADLAGQAALRLQLIEGADALARALDRWARGRWFRGWWLLPDGRVAT